MLMKVIRKISAALLCIIAVLTAVEGVRAAEIHRHWSFVILVLLTIVCLGAAAADDFRNKKTVPLLNHAGLLLVLAGGLAGAACLTEATMKIFEGGSEHTAVDRTGRIMPLPFEISLQEFTIDHYDDGVSPRQYTSVLKIDGNSLKASVNHPAHHKGWHIYQSSYGDGYSVLKIVRNPWLPMVALGALLLGAGAVLAIGKAWSGRKILIPALVLAAAFTVVSVARINFGTLPPALRSLWFAPHLAAYMLAYALLALAVISGVGSKFCPRIPEGLARRLLASAQALLLIGMLCGTVWAQQAWGSFWNWDPKECWAAATWLLALCSTHVPAGRRKLALALTILAFLSMNVTWYGVNHLPSSSVSLHTYNR